MGPALLGFLMKDSTEAYKAFAFRHASPTYEMRPATGPLQTDTYIVEVTEAPGEYVAVKSDRSKFALTNDYRTDEVAKVRFLCYCMRFKLTCISGSSRDWVTMCIGARRKI